MKPISVGIDIVNVQRFRSAIKAGKDRFITNTFSKKEQEYCFSYKDPGPHFAGIFSAKEAVQKAADLFHISPRHIEILRTKSGKPEVSIKGKLFKGITISISHEQNLACACAIYQK